MIGLEFSLPHNQEEFGNVTDGIGGFGRIRLGGSEAW
jgi:hypothetical protein